MTWHLEKSAEYDVTGTWLVFVEGKLAGSIRPAWPGLYSARHHFQGYVNSIRVGKPCRTRKQAVIRVLDSYQRRSRTTMKEK